MPMTRTPSVAEKRKAARARQKRRYSENRAGEGKGKGRERVTGRPVSGSPGVRRQRNAWTSRPQEEEVRGPPSPCVGEAPLHPSRPSMRLFRATLSVPRSLRRGPVLWMQECDAASQPPLLGSQSWVECLSSRAGNFAKPTFDQTALKSFHQCASSTLTPPET